MPGLDPRTLIVSSSVVALCILAVLVVVGAVRRMPTGFGSWTAAQVAVSAGSALIAARGLAPGWASIVLGNSLVLLGLALLANGFARFYGLPRRCPAWLDAAVVLGAAVLLAVWSAGPVNRRIAVFGLASAYFLLRTALEPLASAAARRSAAQRVVTVLNLTGAALALVRVGWAIRTAGLPDLFVEGWTATVPTLLLTVVNLTTVFIAVILCFERAEEQRRAALSEVKTLSGLLPICMHCHRIRNDQGYWDRLERYIGERSDARFTHGLCPECYEEMFRAPPAGGGTRSG